MASAGPAISSEQESILPHVAGNAPGNLGMWAFFAILAFGGIWLVSAMSANRAETQAPATFAAPGSENGRITSAPPLALPRDFAALQPAARPERRQIDRPSEPPRPRASVLDPSFAAVPARTLPNPAEALPFAEAEPAAQARPSVVFDADFLPSSASNAALQSEDQDRVTAGRFANPSRTIPQGTVIPAVLETALDSTRPGAVRALVQRDIYSFDGTRILVQRGSRLYGEYESGLEAGQNRALIQWTRLIRPDGVTIALDSPSSDPLGRAGVKGDVDSKFLQRFGGAILQSVLDIGVGIATREASAEGVVVALPGSTQNLQITDRQQVQRTLKIRHGTSVSVFVARDLDFSTVDY